MKAKDWTGTELGNAVVLGRDWWAQGRSSCGCWSVQCGCGSTFVVGSRRLSEKLPGQNVRCPACRDKRRHSDLAYFHRPMDAKKVAT